MNTEIMGGSPAAPVTWDDIAAILNGIDRDVVSDQDGWWETPTGAEFGAARLAELQALFSRPVTPAIVAEGWNGAAEWLKNNYQAHANIADLCKAMIAAHPVAPVVAEGLTDAAMRMAKWIKMNPSNMPDHACAECVPDGEIIKPGFRCGYHTALTLLAAHPVAGSPAEASRLKYKDADGKFLDAQAARHRVRKNEMNKIIKTWEERAKDAIASGKFVGFPHDHMPAEISDLRAYIAELESRSAAPVVAEGWALKRKDGSGYGGYMFRSVEQAENHNKTNAMGHLYKVVGVSEVAAHPVAPALVVEGWRIVPIEPTDEMRQACRTLNDHDEIDAEWAAMLAAAPAHPVAGSPAEHAPTIDLWHVALKAIRKTYDEAFGPHDPNITSNDIDWHICEIIKAAAAEPMPASEAAGVDEPFATLSNIMDLADKYASLSATNRDRMALRRAIIDAIAAPVPASEAASVNPAIIPEGRVREMVVSAIDCQFEKRKLCAQKLGVAESYLSGCLNGDRLLTDDMLALAGIKRGYIKYTNLATPAAPTDARPEEIVAIAARIFGLKPHKMDEEHKAKYLQFASEVQLMQDRERNPQ